MSTGTYLTPVPRFSWLSTLAEVRKEQQEKRQYLRELRLQVKRHRGYRHDGYWQAKTRADRIEEEIRALEQRAGKIRSGRRAAA